MFQRLLVFFAAHVKAVVIVAFGSAILIWGAVDRSRIMTALKEAQAERQRLQTEVAKGQGYIAVTPVPAGKVEAALSPEAKAELAAIRKQIKETTVALHALSTAKIETTAPGTLIPATAEHPAQCEDAFHRFRVNVGDCTFAIRQSFVWEGRLLRGVDGKTKLWKATLTEFDPVTGLKIPGEPPELKNEIQITEETVPEKVFGLKVLGGVDERFAPGGGLQFAEKWRLSLRALGFYAPKDSDLRGLLGVGWRPRISWFDSQLSVGAGVGLSTKKSGLIYGAHVTVPLGTITK
jgi:hypothetical protein